MSPALNPRVLEVKMDIFASAMGGMMNAAMMHIGERLDLYDGMRGAGPLRPQELADALGLAERFVREWLYQQAAAGIVEHRGENRFELLPETAFLLTSGGSQMAGATLAHLPTLFNEALRSEEAFRTGRGRSFETGGDECARFIDAVMGIWNRQSLVAEALPRLEGVVARLAEGGTVADVGCGAGAAAISIALAFPAARVRGYDTSDSALAVARENLRRTGARNVTFHNPEREPLPAEPAFDLVLTVDCLHDMTRPDIVAAAIRRSTLPDGTWFIVDVDAAAPPEANIARPGADMLFALSVAMCLQSATSEPGGLGLGAVGLAEPAMRELVLAAGFSRFRRVPGLSHPSNAFYEAQP